MMADTNQFVNSYQTPHYITINEMILNPNINSISYSFIMTINSQIMLACKLQCLWRKCLTDSSESKHGGLNGDERNPGTFNGEGVINITLSYFQIKIYRHPLIINGGPLTKSYVLGITKMLGVHVIFISGPFWPLLPPLLPTAPVSVCVVLTFFEEMA